jgi:hypothetical protein
MAERTRDEVIMSIGYNLANIDLTHVLDSLQCETARETQMIIVILDEFKKKQEFRELTGFSPNESDLFTNP